MTRNTQSKSDSPTTLAEIAIVDDKEHKYKKVCTPVSMQVTGIHTFFYWINPLQYTLMGRMKT